MRFSVVSLIKKVNLSRLTTDSFTIKLLRNASSQLFREKTFGFYKNFQPEQLNLEGQWEVAISELCNPSMYQKLIEGNFLFFDKRLSKSSKPFYLKPGRNSSITDVVEAMKTLIRESHNHYERRITVKMSERTQKLEIQLAIERSGLAFFKMDVGHIFGSNVGNENGLTLERQRAHQPDFAYHFVRIHTFMVYTDLIEYNILATRRSSWCVAFFLFQNSRLETL